MSSAFTEAAIVRLAETAGFEIVGRVQLPGRKAKYQSVPSRLTEAVRHLLASSYPNGLFTHQAKSIEAILEGRDVCLSTSTASGKSLAFIAAAAHILREESSARVLALYPARALIQDQISKWEAILEPLGIRLGYIDGGVPPELRPDILRCSRVVLMTPDVAHAWLMSHLRESAVSGLVSQLRLLVLDEAHVYEGVFGTNMAYFLRRLEVVSGRHQLICSTATLGSPAGFIRQLTGREVVSFDANADGSPSSPKTILHAMGSAGDNFARTAQLLVALAHAEGGRFLAFGDSRKTVERIVAAVRRSDGGECNEQDEEEADARSVDLKPPILPYRAGYETDDRNKIQKALGHGNLAGVVSTSAMELGLDIGEIDAVVLLDVPPSIKAFRQRLGRAGRKNPGVCLLIDNRRVLTGGSEILEEYLRRPLEPSWLYLENRYIQYTHALCASYELSEQSERSLNLAPFGSLPKAFRQFLDNELNPTELVPPTSTP